MYQTPMLSGDFVQPGLRTLGSLGDVDFYLRMGHDCQPPILELGCGGGRIAHALARAGIPTLGLDCDRAALQAAARCSEDGDVVAWLQADMARPPLRGPFGLILLPYRGFAYLLDPAAQQATLAAARDLLAPGGRLALDLFNPEVGDVLSRHFGAGDRSRPRRELAVSPDGPVLRLVSRSEMAALLQAAGLHIEALYGGFDGSAFSERSIAMVWVARKP